MDVVKCHLIVTMATFFYRLKYYKIKISESEVMNMWKEYNPNPKGKRVEDCVVRALAKALNMTWNDAYLTVASQGLIICDMPHSNAVWGAVLKREGFKRLSVPNTCPDCYTASDFCEDHPQGVFVLGFGQHVATVIDGILYDSWDSSDEIPQYYWFRRY